MKPCIAILIGVLASLSSACADDLQNDPQDDEASYAAKRDALVLTINDYANEIDEAADPRILGAIASVPRHLLVPVAMRRQAYEDHPLPIGHDQTISQPGLVALMTHLLRPDEEDVILEIGTGSGYQAAILSKLVDRVYTIEIVEPLARTAARSLEQLGAVNVEVKHGDGYLGWPEHAPFDGIIVTAGADHVPAPLVAQLKPGGRMVIPVGPSHAAQRLRLITKNEKGETQQRTISLVRFVPLTRPSD